MPVVIPELVFIIGLFFAVVGYLAARGLLATWTHTIGYLLEALASALSITISLGVIGRKKIDFGGPVRSLDKFVVTAIQNWCDGAEIEMGYCLHGLEKVGRYMAQAIDYGFRETSATFDWLVHVHLPKWARYSLIPALLPFLIPKLIASLLPHVGAKVVKVTHVIEHDVSRTVVKVVNRAVGGAVAFPPWVIRLPHRLRRDEAAVGKLTKRIARVEGVFAAGVLAALMANVLGVATKCLRGGNVGKTARRICGMDAGLVDTLLLDALAIVGVISVVDFAKGMLEIEGEAVKILGAGIREFPS